MKYEMKGGGIISAPTYEGIVNVMMWSGFQPETDVNQFMERTAEAAKLQTGAIISTYNYEEFVTDLVFNGFLKEV